MLLLIRLVVFTLVGFSLVNTVPGPILNRTSRLPSAVTMDQAESQLNRLLLQERQVCSITCGQATVSPYDTFCCENGHFCTTVSGTPLCSLQFQASSSTSPTPTGITPISSSQISDLSSATEGPSSTTEELPTTVSTIVATLTTSASPTHFSTSQSTSAASDSPTQFSTSHSSSATSNTQTSTIGSSLTSSGSVSPPSSSSTNPAASSDGDAQSNKIALGVGIGVGLPAAVAGIVGAYYGVKSYHRLNIKSRK